MTNQKHAMPNRDSMTKNCYAMPNLACSMPNQTLLMTKITYSMNKQKHSLPNRDSMTKNCCAMPNSACSMPNEMSSMP